MKVKRSKKRTWPHTRVVGASGEYIPKRPIWLVFDLANGHSGSHRYVWWFDTRREAREWSKHHLSMRGAYNISRPIRWFPWLPQKGRVCD